MPEGYPDQVLDEEKARQTHVSLIQLLDDKPAGVPALRYTGFKIQGGAIYISCVDQAAKDWLTREIERCVPWENAKLSVIDAKDAEKPVRLMAWFPDPLPVEPEKVLKRLTNQNPGIPADTWRVVDKKPDPKGQQLVLLAGESAWKKLQEKDCWLHYNFGRVRVKALGRKKEEGTQMEVEEEATNPPPSSEPPPAAPHVAPLTEEGVKEEGSSN